MDVDMYPRMNEIDYSMPDEAASSNINLTPLINNSAQRFPMPNLRFRPPFRPTHNNQLLNSLPDDFDGKRLRKSNMRKTVDYNCSIARALQNRVWQRDHRDRHALQPDCLYTPDLLPPPYYTDNPINAVTTRFVKTATNKMRCPIFCMAWTPEGRRLVTGASSGEFTLWNGLTFNFETILQAHDSPVRSMVWSHNDGWMITGDHAGYCKYWQSNMNNVKMFQAHKEAIRGLSFSPTDQKIVSCSDDGTLRIWDFATCQEERVLRGHGSDVKCCGWHPHLGLVASGSKDNQQPIKLWDPKTGNSIATLHAHKATVMDLKWNRNGNWFITASRDHFLKLFDIRKLSQPVQTFRGHKKEASCIAWHPYHEGLLASGGSDGAILFWHVGADKEVGSIDAAHESIVWTLDWHPLGHILCSGSNDHTSKFWTRNRPGDKMRDRYNLNLTTGGNPDDAELGESAMIPGMAPEDRIDTNTTELNLFSVRDGGEAKIPGLLEEADFSLPRKDKVVKKQPYAKPIPKNFMASWNETGMTAEEEEEAAEGYGTESVLEPIHHVVNQLMETRPGVKRIENIEPNCVVAFGKVIPVKAHSKLYRKILSGQDSLLKYLTSGKVRELHGLPGFDELEFYYEDDSSDDDQNIGGHTPTRTEMGIESLELEKYLEPFQGFKEVDLDDIPYRDKDARLDLPRGFGREPDHRREDDRWDNRPRGHGTFRDGRGGDNFRNRWDDRDDDEYSQGSGGGGSGNVSGGPMMGPGGPNQGNPNFRMGPMSGNFMGSNNFMGGPNMGGPNMMGPNMGGPNMMGPNMGGPNMMGPNMGGPNMGGPNMGGQNMGGPNMGGQNMGGQNMGGPNMGGPNMGGHNMHGSNMGGPNHNMMGGMNMGGPNNSGPNMGGYMSSNHMMGPGNYMNNFGGPGNFGGPNMMGPNGNFGGPQQNFGRSNRREDDNDNGHWKTNDRKRGFVDDDDDFEDRGRGNDDTRNRGGGFRGQGKGRGMRGRGRRGRGRFN